MGLRKKEIRHRKSPPGQEYFRLRAARSFAAGPSRRHDARRYSLSIRLISACCPPRPRRCSAGSSPRSARCSLASRRIALLSACYSHVVCPHTPNPLPPRLPIIRLWGPMGCPRSLPTRAHPARTQLARRARVGGLLEREIRLCLLTFNKRNCARNDRERVRYTGIHRGTRGSVSFS